MPAFFFYALVVCFRLYGGDPSASRYICVSEGLRGSERAATKGILCPGDALGLRGWLWCLR
jgi:hypothetical protein